MITVPVAYEWAGLTFCPSCALRSTNAGLRIARVPLGQDMDEAIASMTLAQIERGQTIETPVATVKPSVSACEDCGAEFKTIEEEVQK